MGDAQHHAHRERPERASFIHAPHRHRGAVRLIVADEQAMALDPELTEED